MCESLVLLYDQRLMTICFLRYHGVVFVKELAAVALTVIADFALATVGSASSDSVPPCCEARMVPRTSCAQTRSAVIGRRRPDRMGTALLSDRPGLVYGVCRDTGWDSDLFTAE